MKTYSQGRLNLIIMLRTIGVFIFAIAFWNAISGNIAGVVKNGAILLFFLMGAFLGRALGRKDVDDELGLAYEGDEIIIPVNGDDAMNPVDENIATPSIETAGWDGFDPDAPEYPEELDIALQAWRAVSSNPGPRPKEQIEAWVREHYPHIAKSSESIKRISIIANWSTGGRPPKEGNR